MPVFYDTHAHLDYPDFAADFGEVLARAEAAGIRRLISIGTDESSSRRALDLADRYPNIFAVVGWHPGHVLEAPQDFRPTLRELAQHPKVVALGETGLDFYRLPSKHSGGTPEDDLKYKTRQIELFQQHLEIAAELGLNCVIHQRSSFDDTLAVLKPFADRVRGVFHCFSETKEALHQILEINSMVSFTGILTFKNGQNVREALAATAEGHFMLETDSPYLAPIPYRGKRCEPAYVKETAMVAADVRGCSLETLSETTCAAAHRFFKNLLPVA
jgi:TatD DNase family protein